MSAEISGDDAAASLSVAYATFYRHRATCHVCSWRRVGGDPQRLCTEGRRLWAMVEALDSPGPAGRAHPTGD
jgi:hypothetical protein